ncbi:MAG: bifunctional phosphoribosylaminoimidazolecarboxamide formyltransferase/IMP cyclohydrolase [Candidatus Aenigmatarchaeota archaeon]
MIENSNKYALVASFDKEKALRVIKKLLNSNFIVYTTDGTFNKFNEAFSNKISETLFNNLHSVKEITGFSDFFNGRIKTLHHKIYCSILANTKEDFAVLKEMDLPFFKIVFVDLYPFHEIKNKLENSKDQRIEKNLIEMIDIGGVSLIRAAAKNYEHVYVIIDENDLEEVLKCSDNIELRKQLMKKAFFYTYEYEKEIAQYFNNDYELLTLKKMDIELRYGENYHQKALAFKIVQKREQNSFEFSSIFDFQVTSNKAMSYNNYVDLDALIKLLYDLKDFNCCAIIKHNNPCGVAIDTYSESTKTVYLKAVSSDPVSAFGGVIGFTRKVDLQTAKELESAFIDVIAAPEFEKEALELIRKKKNRRIIEIKNFETYMNNQKFEYKYVLNGFLKQDYDFVKEKFEDFKLICGEKLSKERIVDALLAWIVCKNTKSNAIVITNNNQTIGIGSGQTSRIDAAKIAIEKAKIFKHVLKNSICASDAFLPFEDTLELIAQNNVKVLLQPGGSVNDEKIIKKAEELGITMYFTNVRHFKH